MTQAPAAPARTTTSANSARLEIDLMFNAIAEVMPACAKSPTWEV
ncbi:hypothetical protein [Nocardia sp. SYP-A9097]|nr:hypothetical protein [Nocardia sp. SYP-A9097]